MDNSSPSTTGLKGLNIKVSRNEDTKSKTSYNSDPSASKPGGLELTITLGNTQGRMGHPSPCNPVGVEQWSINESRYGVQDFV